MCTTKAFLFNKAPDKIRKRAGTRYFGFYRVENSINECTNTDDIWREKINENKTGKMKKKQHKTRMLRKKSE